MNNLWVYLKSKFVLLLFAILVVPVCHLGVASFILLFALHSNAYDASSAW